MEPRPLIRRRFRVKVTDRPTNDHWSGGKPYHRGAKCPACKIPLLLLWDINCKDPIFPRRKFGSLKRLPLYFCWGCVNDLSYQVIDDSAIRIHPGKRSEGPSFQYEPYPQDFERNGLLLIEGVPKQIRNLVRKLVARWDTLDGSDAVPVPSDKEQKELTEVFGHSVILPMCLFHHQFGGKPIQQHWADEVFKCPNSDCTGKIADRIRGRKRSMKFLAGILNDPWGGLPMVEPANEETKERFNFYVSVQFHVCDCCWTIMACNRCS